MTDVAVGELVPASAVMIVRAILLFAVGLFLSRIASRLVTRGAADHFDPHAIQLLRRAVVYGIVILFAISALHEVGFKLSVLLGAAGILTVAVGFASQTSASNLVSGLFLLGERPFSVGDVIEIDGRTGEVLSIDLLSAKLRTFDNLYVRIPNETLIKSPITNLTRFPIRRLDLKFGVAYKEDLVRVEETLRACAERSDVCLEEPKPLFIVRGFGESGVDLQFSIWAFRENFLEARNEIQRAVKQAFDEAGIEIPFPHRSLLVARPESAFPVRLVGEPDRPQ